MCPENKDFLPGFDLKGRDRGSGRGFEISQLNSLLSWAFARQDEKIKIIGMINGSMIFK